MNDHPDDSAALAARFRQLAEESARENAAAQPDGGSEPSPPEPIRETLHELRVNQILLEMQNETLRRNQAELVAARERYLGLYELAPVGYLTVGEPGVVLEGNLTAANLLGVPPGSLATRMISRLIHPQDQDIYYQLRKRVLGTGEAQSCELRFVKHDGTPLWVRLAVNVVSDVSGAAVLRVMLHDIHVDKLAELVLAARARLLEQSPAATFGEMLRATLDEAEALTCSSIGFYYFVEADRNSLSLQAWSTNTGRNMCRMEEPGRHCPMDDAGAWADCLREGRAVVHNDYAAQAKRADRPPWHAMVLRELVVPVLRDGRIVAMLGMGNKPADYTEQDTRTLTSLADLAWEIVEKSRMHEELRDHRDYLVGVLDTVSDAIFVEEAETGRILDVNRRMCEMYGYSRGEVLRMPIGDLSAGYPPYAQADALAWHEKMLRHGPQTFEWLARHKNGALFPVEVRLQHATIGTGERIVVTVRDITERKHQDEVRNFLARTSSGTADEPFFNVLARYLAQSLGMDCVCIDHLEGDGLNARSVVLWNDGHLRDNVTYALKDTPCGEVAGQEFCCFPAGVCEHFPHDQALRDLQAESYAGVTLRSHTSAPIGLIAVIGRKPLVNRALVETTLKLVAERASAELERLQVEEALKESEWKFRALFENGPIGVAYHQMIYDSAGKPVDYYFLDANASYRELTGVDPRGKTVTQAFPGIENDPFDWIGTFGRVARSGEPVRLEQYLQSNQRWYDCVAYQYKPDHFVVAFLEITKRKQTERLLQASLSEKESLLQEIHHRVKNNLQIITSLLRLQAGRIDEPVAKAVLLDMQNRVRSMALIHEHLYRSENLAAVDLAAYLKNLCQQLFRTMLITPGTIQLHCDLVPVHIEIDQAIPCGLLVNELVSNALKHAFPTGQGGEVRVELHPQDYPPGWRLRVADNGVGLPPDLSPDYATTMGLRLVSDLARQLGGRLQIGAGPGAVFEVVCTDAGGRGDAE